MDEDRRGGDKKGRRTTGRLQIRIRGSPLAPATSPGAPASVTRGRLRVRGNPNRTPPLIWWHLGLLGQPGHDGPLTGQPAHSLWTTAHRPHCPSPFPEVRRTPLNFQKVQKKPLNFNLALRLLSFIYSDLLVLYIYVLDFELFCNFYIVTNNIICTIRYMYLCNLKVIITAVIIHVYDPHIISRY
jgi:hypothetical protein